MSCVLYRWATEDFDKFWCTVIDNDNCHNDNNNDINDDGNDDDDNDDKNVKDDFLLKVIF